MNTILSDRLIFGEMSIQSFYISLAFSLGISGFAAAQPTHDQWTMLLEKHVNESGAVDYKGMAKDVALLDAYLVVLQKTRPDEKTWSNDAQLAYWINVYNAFTVKLILEHYPVKSIKDIAGGLFGINTPWDIPFIHLQGKTFSLNDIEHQIIRKKFNDPRIHFALVCAAKSCPPLRREAYQSVGLSQQLDDQGRRFLNDPAKNSITKSKAVLSPLFNWYSADFGENGSVTFWVNKYSSSLLTTQPIQYGEYDWSLNE